MEYLWGGEEGGFGFGDDLGGLGLVLVGVGLGRVGLWMRAGRRAEETGGGGGCRWWLGMEGMDGLGRWRVGYEGVNEDENADV